MEYKAPLLVALALLCSISGSTATAAPELDLTAPKAAQTTYINCVRAAAQRYSLTDSTLDEATQAALGRCNSEFASYRFALQEAFINGLSNPTYAIKEADATANETRESLRGRIMSLILELRDQQ